MIVKLASSYGFCFGVKRAIKIAEEHTNSATMGPLIHNKKEIGRLKEDFNVDITNHDKREILIDELKERVKTLKEMASEIEKILTPPQSYNEKAVKKFIKDEVLSTIVNSKERAVILRIVAKLLLRTSRRSDIVAHYGDGIFVMVLKHTDLSSAKMARDRIRDLITTTSFFLGEREVTVDLNIAIVEIDVKKSIEEIVSSALDAL